jgi:hypothetical protein
MLFVFVYSLRLLCISDLLLEGLPLEALPLEALPLEGLPFEGLPFGDPLLWHFLQRNQCEQ